MNLNKIIKISLVLALQSCSSGSLVKLFDFDQKLDSISDSEAIDVQSEKKVAGSQLFVDKAKEYGLQDVKAYNFNVIDLNGDNYSDIVVLPSFYSQPQFYYYNIFEKKFIKGDSPFQSAIKASYILFYDLNNDKILDAVVGVLNQKTEMTKDPLKVFYGKLDKLNNLSFKREKFNIKPSPNSSIGLVDYNLDGRLDFYVGNWFSRYKGNPIPHRDSLYKNTKDGFQEVSKSLRGETKKNADGVMYINATPTYGIQVCDMDQNGYPDVLTTSTNHYANKLWMNRYRFREQNRFFDNVAVASGFASDAEGLLNTQGGGRSFALACSDYNNDGIMDVFLGELTHNYDNDGVDKSSILTGRTLKNSPRFFRTEYTQDSFDPNWHQADRRGIWVDLNNDGLQDLLVDNSGYPPYTKLVYFEQMPDHSFQDKSLEYGLNILNPIASVTLDVNRDGKMDILTSQSLIRNKGAKSRIYLFENQLNNKNKSIRFYLRGQNSNYHGLNATITLKVKKDGQLHYRMQNVSYSYGALPPQNEEGILFGLEQGDEIVNVTVTWPYSKKPNQVRSNMEKTYRFKMSFDKTVNITLCENGEYLVGRRECF
jgi:hypothetical protein